MILVDTSVLIDFLGQTSNPAVDKFRRVLQHQIPFGITAHIFQEILQGTRTAQDYKRAKTYLESQVFYHPQDPVESYAEAAHLYRRCRQRGITPRSSVDCLIAQIALEHDLALLHRDADFTRMAAVIALRQY